MIYLLISVAAFTFVFAFLQKNRVLHYCPVCAGVVLTWAVGLIGTYLNARWSDPLFVGLLMAGSIGALAEKYGSKMGWLWKSLLILIGFPAVYYLISKEVVIGSILGVVTVALVIAATKERRGQFTKEDMFKNCC